MLQPLLDQITAYLAVSKSTTDDIAALKQCLSLASPLNTMPVDNVMWVKLEEVQSNNYNPNSVANKELGLLQLSILNDGYTQPIVTFYDPATHKYIIVDGFHRYHCCRSNKEINARTGGRVPIVVIKKSLAERMASTVRHNRARGKHSVEGMSDLVFKMLSEGMSDATICKNLGMEAEELLKLKHLTGFSKLFANVKYNPSWSTYAQIQAQTAYETRQKDAAEATSE